MKRFDKLLTDYPAAQILMLLCAVALACLQYLTPWQGDDLGYGLRTKASMMGDGPGIGFDASIAIIKAHYFSLNGRFGDMLIMVILSYVPKWLFAAITGAACLSSFYFGSLLAFGSIRKHPMRSMILTGAFICLLPWFCGILIANFTLNYIWGAGLVSIVVYMFARVPRYSSKWMHAGVFMLSLIAAWWHEAYSVAIVPSMILFLLIMRKEKSGIRYAILAGSVMGLILIFSAPGFWLRTKIITFHPTLAEIVRCSIIGAGLSWGVIVGLLGFCFKRYRRKFDRLTLAITGMAACALMCTIAILFNSIYAVRMFWYPDVIAFPVVAMLCVPFINRISPIWRQAICLCLFLFVTVHFCVAIRRQSYLTKEFDRIVAEYTSSADGVVFSDVDFISSGPLLAMRKAGVRTLLPEYRTHSACLTDFYRGDNLPLSLIPLSFKDFNMERFPDGRTTIRCELGFVSRDTLFDGLRYKQIPLKFRRAGGDTVVAAVLINPFRAKDGTQLYYFETDRRLTNDDDIVDVIL